MHYINLCDQHSAVVWNGSSVIWVHVNEFTWMPLKFSALYPCIKCCFLGPCCDILFVFVCLQSEIGFGKLETYVKLDKLGEVTSQQCYFSFYFIIVVSFVLFHYSFDKYFELAFIFIFFSSLLLLLFFKYCYLDLFLYPF